MIFKAIDRNDEGTKRSTYIFSDFYLSFLTNETKEIEIKTKTKNHPH